MAAFAAYEIAHRESAWKAKYSGERLVQRLLEKGQDVLRPTVALEVPGHPGQVRVILNVQQFQQFIGGQFELVPNVGIGEYLALPRHCLDNRGEDVPGRHGEENIVARLVE